MVFFKKNILLFFFIKKLSQPNSLIKLLGKVSGYNLYYSLTHPLKCPLYLVLNFYQINRDDEIRTRDRLVIKILIPCQRTISTQ